MSKHSGADIFAGLAATYTGTCKYEWRAPAAVVPMKVAGPFTAARVREIVVDHVGVQYDVLPEYELASLADLLNMIDSTYQASKEARTNREWRFEVNYATWVLARFFEARRQASEKSGVDRQVVENERRLHRQFEDLAVMLHATPFELDTDWGLTTPPLESWRDCAPWIGLAFRSVMEKASEPLGLSNTGPVARFTREALRQILVGKVPSVANVGQHLKHPYKKGGKT
jgi:hypothetical protein